MAVTSSRMVSPSCTMRGTRTFEANQIVRLGDEESGATIAWVTSSQSTEWFSALAPGAPGAGERRFLVVRAHAAAGTIRSVWDPTAAVRDVSVLDGGLRIMFADGAISDYEWRDDGARVRTTRPDGDPALIVLAGFRQPGAFASATGAAPELSAPPTTNAPHALPYARELAEPEYRMSEHSWADASEPRARVAIGANATELEIHVRVHKSPLHFRAADAPDPELDNEHPDIHSDGVQLHSGARGGASPRPGSRFPSPTSCTRACARSAAAYPLRTSPRNRARSKTDTRCASHPARRALQLDRPRRARERHVRRAAAPARTTGAERRARRSRVPARRPPTTRALPPLQASRMSVLDNVCVVLVEPQDPVNIAAVVRAMKNMGVRRSGSCSPVEYDPSRVEGIAHDTRDIVAEIAHFDDVRRRGRRLRALVGFTARRRAAKWKLARPREAAAPMLRRARRGAGCARSSGARITGSRTSRWTACTPWSRSRRRDHASLNLAQAVLIALYELHLVGRRHAHARASAQGRAARRPPSSSSASSPMRDKALATIEFFKRASRSTSCARFARSPFAQRPTRARSISCAPSPSRSCARSSDARIRRLRTRPTKALDDMPPRRRASVLP